jgi:uncharacterized membrane protein
MNFSSAMIADWLLIVAPLLVLAVVVPALITAPWYKLRQRDNQHVLLGAVVVLLLVWQLKAGIVPGQTFHLLGATLLTLMFGWQFALLALLLILTGSELNGSGEWAAWGVNGLVMVVWPVLLSWWIWRLVVRWLPRHFFVYSLVNGFLCAGIVMASTLALAAAISLCCTPIQLPRIWNNFLIFSYMMSFAEAFFTGMLLTSLVLLRPEWLATFNDRHYLEGK